MSNGFKWWLSFTFYLYSYTIKMKFKKHSVIVTYWPCCRCYFVGVIYFVYLSIVKFLFHFVDCSLTSPTFWNVPPHSYIYYFLMMICVNKHCFEFEFLIHQISNKTYRILLNLFVALQNFPLYLELHYANDYPTRSGEAGRMFPDIGHLHIQRHRRQYN